jgi:uncharacterized protein YutE (UPF0331/DUF86 family)
MDWLQFTAAIIGHLAWPSVLVALFIILRKHMGALADRLLEFSFGGAKVTFDKILQKGAELIEQTPPPDAPKPPEEPQLNLPEPPEPEMKEIVPKTITRTIDRRRKRAEAVNRNRDTATAVIDIFEQVNTLLFDIGDKIGIDAASPLSVMYSLAASGLVSQELSDLYDTLRDARNLLSHAQMAPDRSETLEYLRQAGYLLITLSMLKKKLDSGEIKV